MRRGVVDGIVAAGAGLIFAAGLALSGMTQPAKVAGFLDVAGAWDPSLALVMAGAVGVYFAAVQLVRRRGAPLLGGEAPPPPARAIDARLLGGAALFGIGWGASGFCPGPAIVSVGAGSLAALVFVPAMITGMAIHRALTAPRSAPVALSSPSSHTPQPSSCG